MATIPTGQKFHTVPSNVQTVERGSALANSQREIYTMQDIIDTVGDGGGVQSVVAGTNVTVDNTDPANPIVSASGGGGASGIHVFNPISGQSVSAVISANTFSGSSAVNNRLLAYPFIPARTFTCSALYMNCQIQQAGALARILIYSNLNNLPNTKLFESANLDLSTAGIKTAATTFTFEAGTTYWLALHNQGTASLTHIAVNNLLPIRQVGGAAPTTFLTTATSFPIGSAPNPFGNYDFNAGTVFLIGITIA
jgi:hypothetical protein